MKLTDLDIIVGAFGTRMGGRYWILTVTTSNGIVGWGEC